MKRQCCTYHLLLTLARSTHSATCCLPHTASRLPLMFSQSYESSESLESPGSPESPESLESSEHPESPAFPESLESLSPQKDKLSFVFLGAFLRSDA